MAKLIERPSVQPTAQLTVQPERQLNTVAQDFTQATKDRLEGQKMILDGVTGIVNDSQQAIYTMKQTDLRAKILKHTQNFEKEMTVLEPTLGTDPRSNQKYAQLVEQLQGILTDEISKSGLNATEYKEFLRSSEQLINSKKIEYERTLHTNEYQAGVRRTAEEENRLTTDYEQNFTVVDGKISGVTESFPGLLRNLEAQATFQGYDNDPTGESKQYFIESGMSKAYNLGLGKHIERINTDQANIIQDGNDSLITKEEALPMIQHDFDQMGVFNNKTNRVELKPEFEQDLRDNMEAQGLSKEIQDQTAESYRKQVADLYKTTQSNIKAIRDSSTIPSDIANKIKSNILTSIENQAEIETAYDSGDFRTMLTMSGFEGIQDTDIDGKYLQTTGLFSTDIINQTSPTGNRYVGTSPENITNLKGQWLGFDGSLSYISKYEQLNSYLQNTMGYKKEGRRIDVMKQMTSERDRGTFSSGQFDYYTYKTMKDNPAIESYLDPILRTAQNFQGDAPDINSYSSYRRLNPDTKLSKSEYDTAMQVAYFEMLTNTNRSEDDLRKAFSQDGVTKSVLNTMLGVEKRMNENPAFKDLVTKHWNTNTEETEYKKVTANRDRFFNMARNEKLNNTVKQQVSEIADQVFYPDIFSSSELADVNQWITNPRPSKEEADRVREILDSHPELNSKLNSVGKANLRGIYIALDLYDEKFKDNIQTNVTSPQEVNRVQGNLDNTVSTADTDIRTIRATNPLPPEVEKRQANIIKPPVSLHNFIKGFEVSGGEPAGAYQDNRSNGNLSWGYGTEAPEGTTEGTLPTPEQAEEDFNSQVSTARNDVLGRTKGLDLNSNQLDALTSMYYNVGSQMFVEPDTGEPTELYTALKSKDFDTVAQVMQKYVNSGGERQEGLVKRRRAEGELFLSKNNPEDIVLAQHVRSLTEDPTLSPDIKYTMQSATNMDQLLSGAVVLDQQKKINDEHFNATYGLEEPQRTEVETALGKKLIAEDLKNLANPDYVAPYTRVNDTIFKIGDSVFNNLNKATSGIKDIIRNQKMAMASDRAWKSRMEGWENGIKVVGGLGTAGITFATLGWQGLTLGAGAYAVLNSRMGKKMSYGFINNEVLMEPLGIPEQYKGKLLSAMYDAEEAIGEADTDIKSPFNRLTGAFRQGIMDTTGLGADDFLAPVTEEWQNIKGEYTAYQDLATPKDIFEAIMKDYGISYKEVGLEEDMLFNPDGSYNQDNIGDYNNPDNPTLDPNLNNLWGG